MLGAMWWVGVRTYPLSGKFKFIKYNSRSTDTCTGKGHKPTGKQSYTCITCSIIQPPPQPGLGVVIEVFCYAHAWSTVIFSMMKY